MPKRTELQVKMRASRKGLGMTLQAAADAMGISKGHLHDIESGRHKNPTLWLLKEIRRVYGLCFTCGVTMSHVCQCATCRRAVSRLTAENAKLMSSTNALMRDELAQVRKELAEARKLLTTMEGWSNCVECGARRFDPDNSPSSPLEAK